MKNAFLTIIFCAYCGISAAAAGCRRYQPFDNPDVDPQASDAKMDRSIQLKVHYAL